MEYDSATSLYHTYARYYSPGLQRFLSEDPLQFGGGDVNLFGYAGMIWSVTEIHWDCIWVRSA